MPLIDERGRLFGRVNLIDALVVLVVLVLIPIAYTAFLLFRTPAPRVLAVEPAEVPLARDMRVKVKGTGLRLLFRADVGGTPASAYLFESERSADVLFSRVGPGKYDCAVRRCPGSGPLEGRRHCPSARHTAVHRGTGDGRVDRFGDVHLQQLALGRRFPDSGAPATEILAIGKPRPDELWIKTADTNVPLTLNGAFQVPVLLRTECELLDRAECRIGGISIGAGATVPVPGTNGELKLRIDYVRPDVDPQAAEVVLRVVTDPDLAALIKVGDSEDTTNVDAGLAAMVTAILNRHSVAGERVTRLGASPGDADVDLRIPDRFTSSDVILRMGLDPWTGGWRHKGQAVRVGAPLLFATSAYSFRGSIQRITLRPSSPAGTARTDQ